MCRVALDALRSTRSEHAPQAQHGCASSGEVWPAPRRIAPRSRVRGFTGRMAHWLLMPPRSGSTASERMLEKYLIFFVSLPYLVDEAALPSEPGASTRLRARATGSLEAPGWIGSGRERRNCSLTLLPRRGELPRNLWLSGKDVAGRRQDHAC